MCIFFFFRENKTTLHVNQQLIHMKCQVLLCQKIKTKYLKMSVAVVTIALKVKCVTCKIMLDQGDVDQTS